MPKLALSKYPGGKYYQLNYLYNIFSWADCSTFIDGCAGMGSVSLNLTGFSHVISNDIDSYINNVWRAFQDPVRFNLLKKNLLETEYNLDNYWKARKIYCGGYKSYDIDEIAWATVVSHRMSRNATPCLPFQIAGRMRGGQNECINAWQNYLKSLDKIHEAVKPIEIWHEDICDILTVVQSSNTCIYLDPTYPLKTRYCKMYRTEMSDEKHKKILKLCRESKCKIVISGTPNETYEYMLHDWKVDIRKINNNMSHRKGDARVKKPEAVWSNFEWLT